MIRSISKKIILAGSYGVGKTSLISRFVYQRFSFSYQATLGVRIDRKIVNLPNLTLNMLIWDIGGDVTQAKIPESYYLGSSGTIYVFDVSRPNSFEQVGKDIELLKEKMPNTPILVIGNKADLLEPNLLHTLDQQLLVPVNYYTSALDGTNVEETFLQLAQSIAQNA